MKKIIYISVFFIIVLLSVQKLFSFMTDTSSVKLPTDSAEPVTIVDSATIKVSDSGTKLKLKDKEPPKDTLPPWGAIEPGRGFEIFTTKWVNMYISPYGLFRYINQLPATQTTYVDHNGVRRPVDTRNDFQWHRVIVSLQGFLLDPKLTYTFKFWSLNATNNNYIIGSVTYSFIKQFTLSAGVGSLPGTRTLRYSHPLWLGTDRVMADEFFRPGFTSGIWAIGELFPTFYYYGMIGNSLSQVAIKSSQLTRDLAKSICIWWMPTTNEFGPLSGFSDYEDHKKVATTFGGSYTQSKEDRFSQTSNFPDNNQIRLSDAVLPFETGALAPGVTVQKLNYQMVSANAGMKYKGLFLQAEFYYRQLDAFDADGPVGMNFIADRGFYVQGSYFVLRKRLELYGATSQIFGAFNKSDEYIGGFNVYPFPARVFRINGQVNVVYRTAASSQFGYYIGGLSGTILSISTTVYF